MKPFGAHTREEVDAALKADQESTSRLYGYSADQFTSIEQVSDYIRENLMDILTTEHQESALNLLIEDLEKMKKEIYLLPNGPDEGTDQNIEGKE